MVSLFVTNTSILEILAAKLYIYTAIVIEMLSHAKNYPY